MKILRKFIDMLRISEKNRTEAKHRYEQLINSVYLFGGALLGGVFIFLPLRYFIKNNVPAVSINFVISMFIGYYFTHKKKKCKEFFVYGFFFQAVIMLYVTVLSLLIGNSYPENLYLILCLPSHLIAYSLMEKVAALDAKMYLKSVKRRFIK